MLSVESLVKNALADALHHADAHDIHLNHKLYRDLHLNSMSALMFLMRLEETVDGFYVDPETIKPHDLDTVSSVIRYIHSQRLNREDEVEWVH
ncbi:MAG: hypothetical protein ACD_42C00330G0002 [uncultured bacterium]|nr:MAG: hypothetical protein ACD_42C00330G0002 [uncultured bacterium]OGT33977.1 MAG: hypothetical protein A3C44_07975 [Gammaproteobacteria bacterium RIFCSPHIGHO2_02_FULL_39_13]OGT49200.1 MAG: hypothetical protein A3E53_07005 [Gammaproteobacteria bacterium RIFCSPHIGHO2_12_FULL_39_24]